MKPNFQMKKKTDENATKLIKEDENLWWTKAMADDNSLSGAGIMQNSHEFLTMTILYYNSSVLNLYGQKIKNIIRSPTMFKQL